MMNVLNKPMCNEIKDLIDSWAEDSSVSSILMRGEGPKAFCAGGDVKSMYNAIKEKGSGIGIGLRGEPSADFFREEYEMNFALANSTIPQVSFWDGIVMGGGVGVSIFGDVRIATEKTMFAMPETAIGLFPDVGSSAWLPHLPRGVGTYLALTGCRLKAADLLLTGIATHYMPSAKYEELEHAMSTLPEDRSASRSALEEILSSLGSSANVGEQAGHALLPGSLDSIERCFANKDRVEDILDALVQEVGSGENQWANNTLKSLRKMSPSSLKLTLAQLSQGRNKNLRECLIMEYRLSQGCMREHDFAEGVRALLVDRDNSPVWNPSSLHEVTPEKIETYFNDLGENDLNLPDVNTWTFDKKFKSRI